MRSLARPDAARHGGFGQRAHRPGICWTLIRVIEKLEPPVLPGEQFKMGRAVVHMMTVDNDIVAWQFHIAVFLNIRTAVVGVCLIKAVLQIEVRVVLMFRKTAIWSFQATISLSTAII